MARKAPNGFGSIRKVVKSGRTYFEGRYTDPILHKQKSVSASTEAECRRKLREIQVKITTGSYVIPQKKLVADWMYEWLNSRENLEETTRKLYEGYIRLHIVPMIGGIRLQELRHTQCQQFVRDLAHNPKRDKPLSAKAVHNIVGVLVEALSTAVQDELIASNPALNLNMPRVEKKPPKVMESAEQKEFLTAISGSPYRSIFIFGLNTGMRISEVLGLQWKCINFATGEIRVDKQLDRKRGDGSERSLKGTKTHKGRTIIVPTFVLDLLKQVKRQQAEWKLQAGPLWQNVDGLVFTREDGSPMPHTTIANAFKRIATKIGRSDLSFHSLRHTFITDEIRNGTDVKTVSESAGHSTIAVTMDVYAAATDEMKTAAAQRRQEEYERNKRNA